ncbi:MMS19 nucleotide excision repair protein homolog isoform X2 [Euphorbia lathyris]
MAEDLIYGICEAVDGEKDPQCLLLTFHIVEMLVKLFPDPAGPISGFAADLFAVLDCYFPIHFTHPKAGDIDVKRDDLSRALMLAFSSTPLFEPFAMPLLLEKLSSSLPSAKVDSLKYLSCCTSNFGAQRVARHAGAIWSLLKDAIYSSGEEHLQSFNSESVDDPGNQKYEIAAEALVLLEKLIGQNNDMWLSMIIGDEEINMVFNTIKSYKSYDEVDLESKQKLHMVGRILYICAKESVSSCNKVFENFFPSLLEVLEHSVGNISATCHSNDNCSNAKQPNYGSLYLCIKLLEACRDLSTSSDILISQCLSANERWCCLLQCSTTTLIKIFSSILAAWADAPTRNVEMYLGVKGMQIMAMFPGAYLVVSKLIFSNILMTLMSTVTSGLNETLLWKETLKALVHIGSFIYEYNETEKEMSYMNIVVDKMILCTSSADFSMPWSLKMAAISSVAAIGQKIMLKIIQGLEEAILVNLPEFYVQGNLKSADIILKLLECHSHELLPWIQNNEGFEEVLSQFVVNFWNQIETCVAFSSAVLEKEDLLSETMKTMKLAVAYCSVESQNLIIHKAYCVLSSSTCIELKEITSDFAVHADRFKPTKGTDKFSCRDEWICSLFASVIIALRPQTQIPNTRIVLYLLITALVKGYVTAAQALGSVVNKLDLKPNGTGISGDCTFEEAMDIIFSSNLFSLGDDPLKRCNTTSFGDEMDLTNLILGAAKGQLLQYPAIVGLAWIGKGLLMRGNEKVKDITMIFLKCLLSDGGIVGLPSQSGLLENSCNQEMHHSLMKSAADAFQILMSDSELCLNRKFHAIIRPLYKQRFFSSMMPILYSLIIKSDSSFSRCMLHRALAHVISETPLVVILNDAKKLIPVLVDGLSLLCKDIWQKDIVYGFLLVLSGILTDKSGQEVVEENAHIIIKCLIELVAYPHSMLVRETAIQCLVAMSELPYTRIYPARIQVLQAISRALDDRKRVVRQEAVKCRQAWASIASRGLHH